MSTLRWKPLKSSVKQARALTNLLEALNIFISVCFGLLAIISLANSPLAALVFLVSGIASFFIFKLGYVALELLSEIADDTRLQLLSSIDEEYELEEIREDAIPEEKVNDEMKKRQLFNEAIKAYKKFGNDSCSFNRSIVSENKVILNDINGQLVIVMEYYDGQWIRS